MKRPFRQTKDNTSPVVCVVANHPSLTGSIDGVIFSGGTTLDFLLARSALISRFKLEGCWNFVELSSRTAPIEEYECPGIYFSSEEKPSEAALARRLNRLKEQTNSTLNTRLSSLKETILSQGNNNNAYNTVEDIPNDHPEIVELYSEMHEFKKIGAAAIIESFYTFKWHEVWRDAEDRWMEKRKACHKIFRTALSRDVQYLIEDELNALTFRSAWKKLHEMYSCSPFAP